MSARRAHFTLLLLLALATAAVPVHAAAVSEEVAPDFDPQAVIRDVTALLGR